jgi:hypothetical protein
MSFSSSPTARPSTMPQAITFSRRTTSLDELIDDVRF